jgi:hypothetical protein
VEIPNSGGGQTKMSLKSKVKKSVDIAFDKLKDLAVNATFDNKIVEDFDFDNGTLISTDQSYATIGFMGTTRIYEDGIPTTASTLTIRNEPSVDFNRYTKVEIDEVEYGCNVISKDEFIVILSLAKAGG